MTEKIKLEDIPGIDSDIVSKIKSAGYIDVMQLVVTLPEWIAEDCNISEKEAANVVEKVHQFMSSPFSKTVY